MEDLNANQPIFSVVIGDSVQWNVDEQLKDEMALYGSTPELEFP